MLHQAVVDGLRIDGDEVSVLWIVNLSCKKILFQNIQHFELKNRFFDEHFFLCGLESAHFHFEILERVLNKFV